MDVRLPDGTLLQNVPDGTTKAELVAKLKRNGFDTSGLEPELAVKAGQSINQAVDSLPRQLGLTARYGLEGLANSAQLVTEPLRYVTDKLAPDRTQTLSGLITGSARPPKSTPLGVQATKLADWLGLPAPQSATERVVGDATRLLAGTGGMLGTGQLLNKGPQLAQAAGELLTQQPAAQLASAAGAGLAGGASREAGGSTGGQVAASVLGALGGAGVAAGTSALANQAVRLKNALMTPAQMDIQLGGLLKSVDVDYSQIPERVRQSLRAELGGALKANQELDPAAVARLLDFQRNNLTPTRGMVSLDPVQITREQNLAKMAANSSDTVLQGLPRLQNQNNAQLITNLNQAGANNGNLMGAGAQAIGAIQGKDNVLKQGVTAAYDAARAMPGGTTQLDRKPVVDAIYNALVQENKLAFLPENISSMLNDVSRGVVRVSGQDVAVPFDANALDNLMTMLATAQRGTADGNVKAALTIARKALDGVPITPIKPTLGGNQLVTQPMAQAMQAADGQAGQFMDAIRQAKASAAQRFGWQESGRPIEAALNGAQPDDFVRKFVIGGTLKDARDLAANAPVEPIKNALVAYLKDKALNGAADEVGKFSQSAFNKALNGLVDSGKARLFFSSDEIEQLRSMARAASYMQAQPVGSAVNNSNSGALLLGRGMDALAGLAGKLPFGQSMVVDPLQNIAVSLRQKQAQNLLPGLLAEQAKTPFLSGLAGPAAALGGLLAAPPTQ